MPQALGFCCYKSKRATRLGQRAFILISALPPCRKLFLLLSPCFGVEPALETQNPKLETNQLWHWKNIAANADLKKRLSLLRRWKRKREAAS
jgi:hypothetical protein